MEERKFTESKGKESLLHTLLNKTIPKYIVLFMIGFAMYAAFRDASEIPSGKITLIIAVLGMAAKAVFDDIASFKRKKEVDDKIEEIKNKIKDDGTQTTAKQGTEG